MTRPELARCRRCGTRGSMWHHFDNGSRSAQVECRSCPQKGPAVMFHVEPNPHLAAEVRAAELWNEANQQ